MKTRKLICILLSVVLILGLSGSAFAVVFESISIGTVDTVEGIVEPKVYSTATLEDDFADNRVVVVLNNAASLKLKTYTAADFPEIQCKSVEDLSTASAARVSAKLRGENVAEVFGAKSESVVFSDFYEVNVQEYNQILCLTLPTAGKQNVLAAIKLLMQRDDVKYAGPDYVIYKASTIPDDTYYEDQWGHEKIKLPQAWDIETGKSRVVVGVLDTGIQASHPDLSGQISVGLSRECMGGIAMQISNVGDPDGHGTAVAGIIGAIGDNGVGVAGVAWNIRMASLKVLDERGDGYSSAALAAINYASSAGIPILNMSIGWQRLNTDTYDVALEECIEDFPGLIVCSAGNDSLNMDTDNYYDGCPAEYDAPNLICVGAYTENDTRYYTSNTGSVSVDLFAPGKKIYTTYPTSGYYSSFAETSAAAPHVTGVAALLLSECSTISVAQMKSVILGTVDRVSALSGLCVTGGRLNAYKALQNVHSHTYTHNATRHTGVCNCGHTVIGSHTYNIIGSRYVCSVCGYITMNP